MSNLLKQNPFLVGLVGFLNCVFVFGRLASGFSISDKQGLRGKEVLRLKKTRGLASKKAFGQPINKLHTTFFLINTLYTFSGPPTA
jgi:hypothetical protein